MDEKKTVIYVYKQQLIVSGSIYQTQLPQIPIMVLLTLKLDSSQFK
jgi:hypothetical protein